MSRSKSLAHTALALLVFVLLWQTFVNAEEVDRRKLYVKQLKGCVAVMTGAGPSSGWVVDTEKRWVITCQHVVGAQEEVVVLFPVHKDGRVMQDRAWYLESAPRVKGKVVSADGNRDLAIIQVETLPEGTEALALAGDSGHPGENVYMIGNPAASGAMWNFATGTLRAIYKKRFTYKKTAHEVSAWVGETQLPGNPGDSGAAVFGDNGEVLGVHSGGTPDGVHLMSTYIDVSEVRAFLKEPSKGVARATTFEDLLARGNEQFAKGNDDSALADYSAAIKLQPKSSEAYRCRAAIFIRKKMFDRALDDAQEAVRLDPQNAAAYNERAVCHGAKGELKAALDDYTEAIRLNARESMFWIGRAWTHNNLKEYAKAAADASEALKLDNGSALAYNERGLAYRHLQKLDKAATDLEQAVRLDPRNAEIWFNRGTTTSAQAKFKEAIVQLNEAIRLNPQYAAAFKERGLAYHKSGANDKALQDLDECVKLRPSDAQAYLWRGRCHKALGNQAMAEADLRRAAELDPALRSAD